MDPAWESPGVPIDAIIFGGRRPPGLRDWNHRVFVGAAMRSESTAADEHAGMWRVLDKGTNILYWRQPRVWEGGL